MSGKRLLLLWLSIWTIASAKAQDLQSLLDKTNAYHQKLPVEKMHLHLDKYTYTAGETIWFKAYTTVGIDNLLSNISNIGYVELINPKEKIISRIKIPLVTGLSMSDITLADTLVEGTYRLRAYTNWMRNDSSIYFFNENIQISNGRLDNVLSRSSLENGNYTIKLQDLQGAPLIGETVRYEISRAGKDLRRGRVKTNDKGQLELPFKDDYAEAKLAINFTNSAEAPVEKIFKLPKASVLANSVQFFPEGGNLLVNSINNVAIKTLTPDGLGAQGKTTILSATGDTIATVETNELGMGATSLLVERADTLTAHTVFEDGTTVQSKLPAPVASGFAIQTNNGNADRLYAQVNISPDKQNDKEMYFVVQHLGYVYYASKQPASKDGLIFSVPKKDLPNGIVTISILNDQLQPVIERPVFIYHEDKALPLQVDTDKPGGTAREKITVSLESGKASDTLRTAVLSASVVNTSKLTENPIMASDILSSLLLSADLKGYIENPGYYFDGAVKTTDIDYLLLTQGWRKIDITAPLEVTEPAFVPEKSITIEGQARKLGRKAPVPRAHMTLVPTHNFMDFIDTVANDDGHFTFDNLFFPDSIKFLITAEDEKGRKNIDIIVPEETPHRVGINKNAPGEQNHVNTTFIDELLHSKKHFFELESQGLMERSITIQEVIVTARKPRHKASEQSRNLNGPGNADQIISTEDLETCPTLEMCLNGRLLGVMFRNGVPYTTRGGGEMQVVLDGMYVEGDMLSAIHPMDVQSIEVLRNVNYTSIYGSFGVNGLLIITSKTGVDARRSNYTPKGIATVQPQGFHINKTFYKPEYEPDADTKLRQDLRTTIHWEPDIITDENGNATFDFYTSDEPGDYLIQVEGMDFNGRLGKKTLTIQVK